MTERCEVSRCRKKMAITYLDHGVCEMHWNQLTAENAPPDALRISLGIEAPATAAPEDRTMGEKSTKTKKSATQAKEPKTEKAAKPDLVVFAFRLSEADRDAIHKAAGPGKATRFVLSAALTAAAGDEKGFAALVESRASKK